MAVFAGAGAGRSAAPLPPPKTLVSPPASTSVVESTTFPARRVAKMSALSCFTVVGSVNWTS